MKVLMFGWEYPPHVFGGLATANYGITKGLKHRATLRPCCVCPAPSATRTARPPRLSA